MLHLPQQLHRLHAAAATATGFTGLPRFQIVLVLVLLLPTSCGNFLVPFLCCFGNLVFAFLTLLFFHHLLPCVLVHAFRNVAIFLFALVFLAFAFGAAVILRNTARTFTALVTWYFLSCTCVGLLIVVRTYDFIAPRGPFGDRGKKTLIKHLLTTLSPVYLTLKERAVVDLIEVAWDPSLNENIVVYIPSSTLLGICQDLLKGLGRLVQIICT